MLTLTELIGFAASLFAEKPFKFVGTRTQTLLNGEGSKTILTTGLTGGIDTQARRGDLLVVWNVSSGGLNSAPAVPTVASGQVFSNIREVSGGDAKGRLSCMYCSRPVVPSSITLEGIGSNTQSRTAILMVFRGTAAKWPIGAHSGADGTGSMAAEPPAIAPWGSDPYLLAFAGGATDLDRTFTAAPPGYTDFRAVNISYSGASSNTDSAAAAAIDAIGSLTDPGAFTASGTDANADWSAVTVELNPQNFDGVPLIPIVDSINQKFDSRFGSTFTTETYTSRPIGEASSTRRVVVAIAAGSDHTSEVTVTGVTIGGVTATIHVQNTNFSSNKSCITAIASAIVPTGTTATVAVTFSGATKGCTVWTVPLDKGSSISAVQTLGVDASSGSIARQPGDYVLAVGCAADAQSNYPWMYDGADKIGDTYDHNGAKVMMMAGQRSDPAKGESELIQCNWYGAASRPSLAAVTFR